MIMLIARSPRSLDCVPALEKATGEQVKLTATTRAALSGLRQQDYAVVVVDENVMESDPLAGQTILQHTGTAVSVQVNLAISSMDRVVREVKAALRRRETERTLAMKAAREALRSELKSAVTGILLSSELALGVPELPPAAEIKIKFVRELARSIRQQLEKAA